MIGVTAPVLIKAFGVSDVGLVRSNNEDSFLLTDRSNGLDALDVPDVPDPVPLKANGSIFLVADGMGGGQAGEVASRMAVDLVAQNFLDQLKHKPLISQKRFLELLKNSVEEANRAVFREGQNNKQLAGMGTTLTAAAVHGRTIFFAQLGDSRAYILRNGRMTQMTKDQSLVAQLVAAGSLTPEEAKTHPRRNVILQALGVQPTIDVVISFAELKNGDQLVLCSDGLWGKVEDEEIKIMAEEFDPATACLHLVRMARERGGEDNITVIVAAFDGDGLPHPNSDELPSYTTVAAKTRWWFWPWGR